MATWFVAFVRNARDPMATTFAERKLLSGVYVKFNVLQEDAPEREGLPDLSLEQFKNLPCFRTQI